MTSIDPAPPIAPGPEEALGVEPGDGRESSTSDLGARLRQLRRSRGVSLADVAEGSGISPSFLSMVEKGKSDITISRLMRLVHWFGVSVADLVQEPNPSSVQIVPPTAGDRCGSQTRRSRSRCWPGTATTRCCR